MKHNKNKNADAPVVKKTPKDPIGVRLSRFGTKLKINHYSRKNNTYLDRISLYKDYSIEKRHDFDLDIENRVEKHARKLWENYSDLCYKAQDKKPIFDYITRLEKEKLEQELRLKYRRHREESRREIQKLAAKNEPDLQTKVAAINEALANHEKQNVKDVQEFVDSRVALYEQQVKEGQISTDTSIDLVNERKTMDLDIIKFRGELETKYIEKYEEFIVKNNKRIEKYDAQRCVNLKKLEAILQTVNDSDSKISIPDDVLLRSEHLCMFFGGVKAVNDLSFDVKQGEIFGLIGPNGAGKTTVFNCITQFYKPTSGNLYFRNRYNEVVDLRHEKVHNIILQGIVRTFQNLEVVKEVSVLDNLLIAAHRQYHSGFFTHMLHLPILGREEKVIRARADKVLLFMGLQKYRNYYAMGLPYGILKKIEIARTLMCSPRLIILDEPAAGLNDSETAELTELIRTIKKEYDCTILLVEHDMGLVMNVCDRICAISFGRMLALGTPKEIQQNKDVQAAYLGMEGDE